MAIEHLDTTMTITVPSAAAFPENENGQQDAFLPANDILDLATTLIDTCPELAHLHTVRWSCLWKREGGKAGGKLQLGKCKALSGEVRYYSECDFLLWLAADHVREFAMTDRQIEALVFHQLKHADIDEETMKCTTRPHDLELFVDEVSRYGLWTSELKESGDTIRQAALPLSVIPFGGRM